MYILIETIILLVLSIIRFLYVDDIIIVNKIILNIIQISAIVASVIPVLLVVIKKGIGALSISYNITSTNLILVLINVVSITFVVLKIKYVSIPVAGVVMALHTIKMAIDLIKVITHREVLV